MAVQMNGCKFNLYLKILVVNPSSNLQEKWALQPCLSWSIQKTLGQALQVTFLRVTGLWVCKEWFPIYKITKHKIINNVKIAHSHWAAPYLSVFVVVILISKLVLQAFRQKYDFTLRQFQLSVPQDLRVSCLDNMSNLYVQAWEETQFALVPVGLRSHGPEKTMPPRSEAIDECVIISTGENKIKWAGPCFAFCLFRFINHHPF